MSEAAALSGAPQSRADRKRNLRSRVTLREGAGRNIIRSPNECALWVGRIVQHQCQKMLLGSRTRTGRPWLLPGSIAVDSPCGPTRETVRLLRANVCTLTIVWCNETALTGRNFYLVCHHRHCLSVMSATSIQNFSFSSKFCRCPVFVAAKLAGNQRRRTKVTISRRET